MTRKGVKGTKGRRDEGSKCFCLEGIPKGGFSSLRLILTLFINAASLLSGKIKNLQYFTCNRLKTNKYRIAKRRKSFYPDDNYHIGETNKSIAPPYICNSLLNRSLRFFGQTLPYPATF
jgi:hypothetical protein